MSQPPPTPHPDAGGLHLVFFERAGDARAAFERARTGGEEYYHGEQRAVALKRELAGRFGRATVVTATGGGGWDERLTPRLRAVGLGRGHADFEPAARAWLDADPPTHLIVGPEPGILEWAAGRRPRVEVLPNFAHTFFNPPAGASPLARLRRRLAGERDRRRFAAALRRLDPLLLLNHNLVAAEDLRRLAPRPERVSAFEVVDETPLRRARERALDPGQPPRVFFCGRTDPDKGLSELIQACGLLTREGLAPRLVVCGAGDGAAAQALADASGLGGGLEWRGPSPRSEVIEQLERAAVAAVPSWPSCPEGLPLTLMEPLGMGVPVVASGHRAWARLREGEQVVRHRGSEPAAIASALRSVLADPALHARLSRNGPDAFRGLRCPEMLADAQRRWADLALGAVGSLAMPRLGGETGGEAFAA